MGREIRPNSGTLGTNKRKRPDSPNDPGYDGSCQVSGVDYWISAWVKEGPTGKFFSLTFKPKNPTPPLAAPPTAAAPNPQPRPAPVAQAAPPPDPEPTDDDVPF